MGRLRLGKGKGGRGWGCGDGHGEYAGGVTLEKMEYQKVRMKLRLF